MVFFFKILLQKKKPYRMCERMW